MKTNKSDNTQNIATAVSAALGSVAGVAIGTVASEELMAAEPAQSVEAEVEVEEEPQPAPTHTQTVHHSTPTPKTEPEPEPVKPEPVNPEHEPVHTTKVEVLSFETQTYDDGSQSDVAILSVNGTPVMLADVDRDGLADIMACDENGNGSLDMGEVIDVSDAYIAMQPLQEVAGTGELLPNPPDVIAQNVGLPDYVNDADVGGFMA